MTDAIHGPGAQARSSDQAARPVSGRARTSLRRMLWGLVLALALPAILVAAGGLYSVYRAEREATDMRLRDTTRALTLSLDREIEKAEVVVRALATSPHLRSGDFEAFHRQAAEPGVAEPGWIALFEPGGRAILNTRRPYGDSLPGSLRLETLTRVAQTRRPEVSDLFTGGATGQSIVALDYPVAIGERVAYILSIAIGSDVFQKIIADQRIAAGWNGAVVDRTGRIVARSRSPEQFVGQFVRPRLIEAIGRSAEGRIESVTLDGVPSVSYFSRSPVSGWSFVIGVPASELERASQRPVLWLLLLTGVIGLGIALAAFLSRAIARPVDDLVASARALGRGEIVSGKANQVMEFDAIQSALAEASGDLQTQKRVRDEVMGHIAESEARLRQALNAGDLGSWDYAPSTDEFTASAACRAHFGRGAGPFTYADLMAAIHPDDRRTHLDAMAEAMAGRMDLQAEYRVVWPDRSVHWVRLSGRARLGADGQFALVGVSQDITSRREADERQALLLHELNHRVKNTLATVQSVAAMTKRSAQEGDPAAWDAFLGRLQGLAKTHDLLTATSWGGALLKDVLASELEPYQDALQQRIKLRGPPVNLQPGAVLALGLAVHELATNAAKYGSLSVADGRVGVMWAVTAGACPTLLVEWTETGGPSVAPPERQGFGTKLIQRGLAQQLGGEIKLEFKPAGVHCVITFPIELVALPVEQEERERYAS